MPASGFGFFVFLLAIAQWSRLCGAQLQALCCFFLVLFCPCVLWVPALGLARCASLDFSARSRLSFLGPSPPSFCWPAFLLRFSSSGFTPPSSQPQLQTRLPRHLRAAGSAMNVVASFSVLAVRPPDPRASSLRSCSRCCRCSLWQATAVPDVLLSCGLPAPPAFRRLSSLRHAVQCLVPRYSRSLAAVFPHVACTPWNRITRRFGLSPSVCLSDRAAPCGAPSRPFSCLDALPVVTGPGRASFFSAFRCLCRFASQWPDGSGHMVFPRWRFHYRPSPASSSGLLGPPVWRLLSVVLPACGPRCARRTMALLPPASHGGSSSSDAFPLGPFPFAVVDSARPGVCFHIAHLFSLYLSPRPP